MGDRHDRAGIAGEELLEPVDRLGVEVVGGLVEEQHVGLGEQHAAQRDAALLAARKLAHDGVPRREPEGIGGDLELHVGVLAAGRGNLRLELGLLRGELVEVGVGLAVFRVDLVESLLRRERAADAFLDGLAHGLLRIHHRLLRQVADLQTGHGRRLAFDVLVDAGHDLEQGRLAGPVQAEHADLGAGKERERDVLEDLALGRNDLAHAVHREDVLSHATALGGRGAPENPGPMALLSPQRGKASPSRVLA